MLKQSHHLKWLNAVYSGEMVKCHESETESAQAHILFDF